MTSIDTLIKRIDQSLIYPPLLARYRATLSDAQKEGVELYATSGTRWPDEQMALYVQGRTAPGKVVTNARPYQSFHQYGIAIDSTADADLTRDGLQPSWDMAQYAVLAHCAKKNGLDAAYFWEKFKEGPHVQLDVAAHGITWSVLMNEYKQARGPKEGLQRVWAFLDSMGPW